MTDFFCINNVSLNVVRLRRVRAGLETDKQNYHTMLAVVSAQESFQSPQILASIRCHSLPTSQLIQYAGKQNTSLVSISFQGQPEIQHLNTLAQSLVQGCGEESECYAVFTEGTLPTPQHTTPRVIPDISPTTPPMETRRSLRSSIAHP